MKKRTLDDLFHERLREIYFSEKEILSALPQMAKAAQRSELKAAFERHRAETVGHIERLERVFAIIEEPPQGKTCSAILSIIAEGAELLKEYKGSPPLDVGLIDVAQAVGQYKMTKYASLTAWASELNLIGAASELQETLEKEVYADEALSALGESFINQTAA